MIEYMNKYTDYIWAKNMYYNMIKTNVAQLIDKKNA